VTRDFYLAVAIPGTISGTVRYSTDTTFILSGATLVLRRGSATGSIIDSVVTDSTGTYTFSNVAPGAPNYWITVSTSLAPDTTLANVAVGNGVTLTRNIVVTGGPVSIHPIAVGNLNRIQFSRMGDRLILDLGVSSTARSVTVFNMNGALQHRASVPAGESRASVPATFAPANGFLFQVR